MFVGCGIWVKRTVKNGFLLAANLAISEGSIYWGSSKHLTTTSHHHQQQQLWGEKSKKKRRDVKHASNFSTLQRLSIKCRGSYTPSCMTALACQGFIWTLRRLKAGSLSVFPRQIPTQLTCWAIRLCQALHIVIISYFLCPKWLMSNSKYVKMQIWRWQN